MGHPQGRLADTRHSLQHNNRLAGAARSHYASLASLQEGRHGAFLIRPQANAGLERHRVFQTSTIIPAGFDLLPAQMVAQRPRIAPGQRQGLTAPFIKLNILRLAPDGIAMPSRRLVLRVGQGQILQHRFH